MKAVIVYSLLAFATVVGTSTFVTDNTPDTPYCVVNNAPSLQPASSPLCADASAWGTYAHSSNLTGWHTLRVTTNASLSEWDQAYAAGYFEGAASVQEIYDFYLNQIASIAINPKVTAFFKANIEFMDAMLATAQQSPSTVDPTTRMMARVWMQFKGIADGYQSAAGPNRQVADGIVSLWMTGDQADFYDVIGIYPADADAADKMWNWRKLSPSKFDEWFALRTHCSALVRRTPSGDIMFGHATWQTFTFALRLYKIITIHYPDTPAKTMSYSSYPATLSSTDDFHVLDSGLAVMETSLSVFNVSVFDSVTPQSVMTALRSAAANRLASSALEWVTIFSKYNSGTYNNQWQVLEIPKYKLIGMPVGKFLAVEQMPGFIATTDMAPFISQEGYWASYNVPYNLKIFNALGYPEAIQQQGPTMLSYDQCVRAQIFRQRAPDVSTIEDMKFLMQYNDYKHDPISLGNPVYAIAARGDLKVSGASAFGALDCKISNIEKMLTTSNLAFSGPTPQQPVFDFTTTAAAIDAPYNGVPVVFNFTWVTYSP